jgi:hypothetical protein
MEGDTQGLPADAGQVAEPLTGTEPSESSFSTSSNEPVDVIPDPAPAVPVAPDPATPRQMTPEEIEERAFQRTASWTGRELKKFSDVILQNIEARLPRAPASSPPPSTDPATMLENPDGWLRSALPGMMREEASRQQQAEQNFNTELIRQAAATMDSDPLFADKNLGNAVVSEIQKNFNNVNRTLHPEVAAQLLVSTALANVVRQNALRRSNGLAGNRPATGPIGTVTPPANTTAKPAPIKIDDMTKRIASYFGNTPEQIQEMLK